MPNPMRALLLFAAGLFVLPVVARAQGQAGLALEVNRYYGEQGRALVEGAVEVPFPLMTFAPSGESHRAHARVEVAIERVDDGEQVYHTEREIEPEAANEAMAMSDRVSTIETFAIYAPPGEYVARARMTDLSSNTSYEMTTPLNVPETRPFFSDVMLSNRVQRDIRISEDAYLPYLIGTTMFNPNPRNVFYKDSPLLYFYYEVNPAGVAGSEGVIDLTMEIVDVSGTSVKNLGARAVKLGDGSNFDLGAFNIAGLAPGRYDLVVRCTACEGDVSKVTAFDVRAPHEQLAIFPPEPEAEPAEGGRALLYYADLSEAQVDSVIDVMDVWFTQQQRQLLGTLNQTGKLQFLNRFWQSLDADPSIGDPTTDVNEPKQTFEQRIAYADQFFASSQRLGRDTDRGRIYVLFGEPTERFDRPYEATLGPYEIWNYSNQGQTFAFGDFRRDGDYRLIYSTDRRFRGDPTIQSQVDRQGSSGQTGQTIRFGRGYEDIIEDIRTNRVTTGSQL